MFLSMICKDALAVRATHLLVAFDGANVFRYSKDPNYKATRNHNNNDCERFKNSLGISVSEIYNYLPDIISLLTELGISYCQPDTFEADDVGCSAASLWKNVIIGTKDKDSYQFLREDVSLYDSSYKKDGKPYPRYITKEIAEKSKNIPVDRMVLYQTLIGDKIDNIPSVLSPAKARNLINKYHTYKNIIKNCDDSTRIHLKANTARMMLNKELVTLRKDVPLPDLNTLKVGRKNLDNCLKKYLPKSYFDYVDFVCPRTNRLF